MFIPDLILLAALATRPPITKPMLPKAIPVVRTVAPESQIVDAIRNDFEALAGPGSVEISTENGKLLSIRIAVPTLSLEFCAPIYEREIKLFRIFPELNFDFYVLLRQPR